MAIPVATLAARWSDPDGDPVVLSFANVDSVGGENNVGTDGNYIYYTNLNTGADTISYTIADVRSNPPAIYRPDDTQQTGEGIINLLSPPFFGHADVKVGGLVFNGSGGIAGGTYYVITSTNLALPLNHWTIVTTNQFDSDGSFSFTNSPDAGAAGRYFSLLLPQ
jgi:hypothetical protein